jgi:phosphatidylinositol 4-kinase
VLLRGFMEVRKHAHRVCLLVEVMMSGGNSEGGMACFAAGTATLAQLRARFQLQLSEAQVVEHVMDLIEVSVDSWRTRQYDSYQRITNGIL